jgi:general secretion pathway protein H
MPNSSASLRIKAFEIAALLRADRNAAVRTGRVVETAWVFADRLIRSGANGGLVILPDHMVVRVISDNSYFKFFPNRTSSGGAIILSGSGLAVSVHVDNLTAAVSIRRDAGQNAI